VTLGSLLVVTIIVILDHGPEWTGLMMTFGDSVLILLFAAIVAICVDGSHLASWVSASWLVRMGKYSYSMYLFQEIVYELTPRFLKDFTILSPFLAKLLFIPGAIGVTFVCGALSWRLFERRFLVLKDLLAPRAI
jgi:peptidoglycan/LPS O-acetylase OafA/YrhL